MRGIPLAVIFSLIFPGKYAGINVQNTRALDMSSEYSSAPTRNPGDYDYLAEPAPGGGQRHPEWRVSVGTAPPEGYRCHALLQPNIPSPTLTTRLEGPVTHAPPAH
ncbi:hypothetical protein E2C01_032463 [Portunus trituberculatus]|uniref:Uncharacterized protein n=1 Tax=Portunus trituberculatus TaxID=210409 RepID=A0A5B7EZP3_PORTR|nr:hypothetical protein [Portunus trituberculatus]